MVHYSAGGEFDHQPQERGMLLCVGDRTAPAGRSCGPSDSILPNGHTAGSSEDALDCACGLYLNDPTAWADQTPAK